MAECIGCIICGENHDTANCRSPIFPTPCSQCFVTSLNGNDHESPCMPYSKTSSFRRDIYAVNPVELFRMKLMNADDWFYVLNPITKDFEMVNSDLRLQSAPAECTFSFSMLLNGQRVLSCDATTLTRFTVLVAFIVDGQWRFRFRFLVTDDCGILCFPMRKACPEVDGEYFIPKDFRYNTALVIGIGTKEIQCRMKLRIQASLNANINNDNQDFNGYYGDVIFHQRDEPTISPSLCRISVEKRRFNARLYNRGIVAVTHNDIPIEKKRLSRLSWNKIKS